MEKKYLRDVHVNVRDMYNRAVNSAKDPKNVDYSITLMSEVVRRAPALAEARTELRKLEKMRKPGFFAKMGAKSSSKKAIPKIQAEMAQSPLRAMAMCEAELAKDINNIPMLKLLSAAAKALKADFIELEVAELIYEFQPADVEVATMLAEQYQNNGNHAKAAEIYTMLSNKNPNDYELAAKAKTAMNAMNAGKEAEKLNELRQKSSSTRANATMQLENGTIHDSRQAQVLINKYEKELKNNDSLDMRRKLAEAYMIAGNFDGAIGQLELVAQKLGTVDPALDKAIELGYVAKYNAYLTAVKNNPKDYENPEHEIEVYTAEREKFRLERAEGRMKLYPNDAQLQYDYAELCYANGKINEATQHFEEAYKSQRLRILSGVYLGRCAIRYKDYAKSIEYLLECVKDMARFDKRKMEAIYYLGVAYERNDQFAEAKAQFEILNEANKSYRDVEDRISECERNM